MAKQEDLDKRGEDNLILGTVQIMVGVFCILMWYLLLLLYLKQIKAIFGTYEPITYKAACALWGTLFIATGIVVMKISSKPTLSLILLTLFLNLICMAASIAALVLTVIELKNFPPVSYRNYGQAKIGREISRSLMFFYFLECFTALASLIFCILKFPVI